MPPHWATVHPELNRTNNGIKLSNKFQHLDSKTKITDDDVKALNSWAKINVAKLGDLKQTGRREAA